MSRGRHAGAWNKVALGGDEQFELKRKALLREAARAFSANGYHATSLLDVAVTLGVTKTALYHYVKSKQEILLECHLMSLDLGDRAVAYSDRCGGTGRERIRCMTTRYLELLTSELGSVAVLVEFNALTPENRAIVAIRRDAFERHFRALVKRGIKDGSLRDTDPKLAVFFFMGAVNWLTQWFKPSGEYTGEHIAAQFSELLDEAIRAR